ncbi:MAG: PepSY domain-containing protein [Rhodobacteraceae bacterium]|nr:PepSY domain-containing protein [Paracoccaceae bacterium]
MTDATHGAAAPAAQSAANKFRFIAWRWHFYAGLYVIPFLLMLAVTGLVMLWSAALLGRNDERMTVATTGEPLATSALQAIAEAAVPGGHATQYIEPLSPAHVAAFAVEGADGTTTGIALDPHTGAVMDSFAWGGGWYDFADKIHGTLMIGTLGDRLIEIAASLGLMLVASGLYLHWPRGGGSLLKPNLVARGRSLWKTLHGTIGIWMSLLLVFFLISGLSWAGVWGDRVVQAWSTFPVAKWDNVPVSDAIHASMNHDGEQQVPWGLEKTPMPASGSLAGTPAVGGTPDIDGITHFARTLGFEGRFQVNLPGNDTGVWTISHDTMSKDGGLATGDRTIHIDRYTGNVLADVRYADYSPYAKAMAWGIALHEGDMGLWNIALNTIFCLSVIFLSVSGVVMWIKRRPTGAMTLAAPPRPNAVPFWAGAAFVVFALGIAFPMGGAAVLAVLILDATLLRTIPLLRRALS